MRGCRSGLALSDRASLQPERVLSPSFIGRLVRQARLRRLALERGEQAQGLSLGDLLHLHGQANMPVLLIVLALITTLPVAGAGMVFSLGIMAWAWRWFRRQESLSGLGRFEGLQMSPRAAIRSLRWLAWIYLFAMRSLRPRWVWLHSMRLRWFWSVWVVLMALIIFLPIPLGNLFPAVSLLMFGLGLLTRDGLMLVLSLLLGLAGLSALVAAAGWLWRVVASTWPF